VIDVIPAEKGFTFKRIGKHCKLTYLPLIGYRLMALRNRVFCKCSTLLALFSPRQLKGAFHFLLGKLSSYISFNSLWLLSKNEENAERPQKLS